MSRLVVCLSTFSVVSIIAFAAASQGVTKVNRDEIKHILVPMPNGLVNAEAINIDKDWTPPIVHLRGSVSVRIYTATKDPRGAIVMKADEVDLNQTSGEILPRGNVRLVVQDRK